MRRYIYLTLLIFLLALSACSNGEKVSNDVKHEGYIIEKRVKNGFQILVIGGVKKEDIQNKTLDELIKQAQDNHSAIYFFVKEDDYRILNVGQKVAVWLTSNQPIMESSPPQTDAKKIEVIEE